MGAFGRSSEETRHKLVERVNAGLIHRLRRLDLCNLWMDFSLVSDLP
jgi:hypothetical protein